MSDLAFVALAYGIVWLLVLGYVFNLVQREQELRRDLRGISDLLRERELMAPTVEAETAATVEGQAIEVGAAVPAR